ncbi:hypothetical protein Rctr197k_085 [Virus Rctr197k]|nr:hypothetical protein Rctr197k_085 [Virus Rctr197k]
MTWDAEHGWTVFAPVALSMDQLERIAKWAEVRQVDRFRSLPHGELREECKRTVEDLQARRIRCLVQNQEGVVFAATERTRPERAIFVMGEEGKHG